MGTRAAVNTRAIERQLEILKEMGVNAYRASHNPPAPEVLDLCDRMGILVMDETFDMWRKKKTSHDYARYFPDWHGNLTDLIVRDRNHPSVIIYSIGNEVLEQWSSAKADTLTLEQANLILNFGHGKENLAKEGENLSVNSLLTKKLAGMVKDLDPSRPVTAGCNEPDPGNHLFRSGALDIIGYNYHDNWFDSVPGWFPDKPFIISESVSALMTRGYYRMPSDSLYIGPSGGISNSATAHSPVLHMTTATRLGAIPMKAHSAMWTQKTSSPVSSSGPDSTTSESRHPSAGRPAVPTSAL